jgi:hypothetical protein
MKREEIDALVADVMAEHFARLRSDLEALIERAIAAKPLPPFVPPPVWTEGKHGAGSVVRAHGGIFYARRDTDGHPGDDDGAWLPLVVGLAGFDMRWVDDHKFVCMARLSDGRLVETEREIAVPIVRGYWNAETNYLPGDRVFRYGEHSAVKMSMGIDPTSAEAEGVWEKVGGKYARTLTWALDEASLMLSENGRDVGSIRPGLLSVVEEALAKHIKAKAA